MKDKDPLPCCGTNKKAKLIKYREFKTKHLDFTFPITLHNMEIVNQFVLYFAPFAAKTCKS